MSIPKYYIHFLELIYNDFNNALVIRIINYVNNKI
jgi:hypothetical protein